MSDTHECSGCYLWENKIESICSYQPIASSEIICPCVTCLVKTMCTDEQGCDEYTRVYNPEYFGA